MQNLQQTDDRSLENKFCPTLVGADGRQLFTDWLEGISRGHIYCSQIFRQTIQGKTSLAEKSSCLQIIGF